MLWHFLIESTHGNLYQCCSTHCLSCSIVAEDPHIIFLLVNPTQHRLCSYLLNMGGHSMWWKGWFDIHATLFYQYEGVGWCIVTLNTKINWGLGNIPWPDGWSFGSRYSHSLPGLWFQESPADDKNVFLFSSICTGIHSTKYNCVLQWMLVHRDPKRATIAPLTNRQSWTDSCVQSTLGTYPEPVWNKEATLNGFGPCGNPFHGNEKKLWCNTNRQPSYNEKKQLRLVRRFGHFLRRQIRTRTHGEMVISTETDF